MQIYYWIATVIYNHLAMTVKGEVAELLRPFRVRKNDKSKGG